MKKILIVDNHAKPNEFDFSSFPFVISQRELPDIEKYTASDIETVFVHSKNLKERNWANKHNITPRFIFGDDIVRFNQTRETINIPRSLYAERIFLFLKYYQINQNVYSDVFSMKPESLSLLASQINESEQPSQSVRLILRSIRIQGVKSARDTGVLAIPKLCVLVGRNGSGKSTIIETLQWLQECSRHGLAEATAQRFRSFRDLCTKGCDRILIDLHLEAEGGNSILSYSLELESDERELPRIVSESCRWGEQEEIKTNPSGHERARSIQGGNPVFDTDQLALSQVRGSKAVGAQLLLTFVREAVFLRLHPRALAQPGALHRPLRSPRLDEEGAGLPALLEELAPSARASLLGHLRETLGSSIQDVDLERNLVEKTGVLVLNQRVGAEGASFRLPGWVLSEGTRRLTAYYALLSLQHPPSLIAIEEVENGLDPWTLSCLLDALRNIAEDRIPVLLTTHSPYFLDKFEPQNIIHVTCPKGESLYRNTSTYDDVIKYEGEIPPGVLYTAGYFKGKQ